MAGRAALRPAGPAAVEERVCIGRGSWQLITLAAALRTHLARAGEPRLRTTLALSGERLSPALRAAMEELAAKLDPFERVVWIDDAVAGIGEADDAALRERLDALAARLELGAVREVWTANPVNPQDRAVLERCRDARVVVFEDGLHTYSASWPDAAPLSRRAEETAKLLVRRALRRRDAWSSTFRSGVPPLRRRRRSLSAAYLVLAGRIAAPPAYAAVLRTVAPETLREVVERLAPPQAAGPVAGRGRRALVLSSSYAFWHTMSREQEARLYADVLRRVAAAGYEPWWKEHPRSLEPFLPELRRRLPGLAVRPYDDDHAMPLELSLRQDPVDILVAGTSTSLLYMPVIFGDLVQVASFAAEVRPLVRDPRLLRTIALVEGAVPGLAAALAEGGGRAPTTSTGGPVAAHA